MSIGSYLAWVLDVRRQAKGTGGWRTAGACEASAGHAGGWGCHRRSWHRSVDSSTCAAPAPHSSRHSCCRDRKPRPAASAATYCAFCVKRTAAARYCSPRAPRPCTARPGVPPCVGACGASSARPGGNGQAGIQHHGRAWRTFLAAGVESLRKRLQRARLGDVTSQDLAAARKAGAIPGHGQRDQRAVVALLLRLAAAPQAAILAPAVMSVRQVVEDDRPGQARVVRARAQTALPARLRDVSRAVQPWAALIPPARRKSIFRYDSVWAVSR